MYIRITLKYSGIKNHPETFKLDITQFKEDIRTLLEPNVFANSLVALSCKQDALELMIFILEHFEGLEDQLWAGAKDELRYGLKHCLKQIQNHPAIIQSTIDRMTLPELFQAMNTVSKDYKKAFDGLYKTSKQFNHIL